MKMGVMLVIILLFGTGLIFFNFSVVKEQTRPAGINETRSVSIKEDNSLLKDIIYLPFSIFE